jgi:hypothetical protein
VSPNAGERGMFALREWAVSQDVSIWSVGEGAGDHGPQVRSAAPATIEEALFLVA